MNLALLNFKYVLSDLVFCVVVWWLKAKTTEGFLNWQSSSTSLMYAYMHTCITSHMLSFCFLLITFLYLLPYPFLNVMAKDLFCRNSVHNIFSVYTLKISLTVDISQRSYFFVMSMEIVDW